ncbi:Ppx/GppA family phosphatase [Asticcacaulis excentricus]|uniref:Ppx/GppA phosphatase n=1 Tax=Asticcacaulis excentricus (strain ATCC 15261 / DSM 4724 / KCTC 12464 / NCIMB 9791 / VKM B-1370 / CB 48) TaxID=573065 RepID=E8RT33_ASTEC|nr:Ppx/GppA family phosphatase [Asticcacaulis excentricus]ADU14654.1 Ppx/GppA phosphatase [Asticcacaulis excentricus CB 48]
MSVPESSFAPLPIATALLAAYYTAVIDIGSNSVRLVIYRIEGRSIWPVHNEKVLAGLGRELMRSGRLSPSGCRDTLIALKRFRFIVDSYPLSQVHTVATAAIREAADGPGMVQSIEAETGFKVRVLSGAEEAYYSALGVLCGHDDAVGVVGDLGGSSLELIDLQGENAFKGITLPLGPFALGAPAAVDIDKTLTRIREVLTPHKDRFQFATFHAVGGAWRNLAIIWMQKANYPLQIVQQFELPAREALNICRLIATQSPASLERIRGVTKRRMEHLAYAALVLQALIETFGFDTINFSANGLREGVLFEQLPKDVQKRDPLIEGCAALGARQGISNDMGPALAQWVCDFYDTASGIDIPDVRLIRAAAKLADMGALLHPDHRADLVCDQVLRAPIPGQNHAERVFLACTLFTRYSGDAYTKEPVLISRILGDDGLERATRLGLALRLGCDLSAKSGALLSHAHLTQQGRDLVLEAKSGWEDLLLGEQTKKRAKALANALKLNLKMGSY